MKDHLRCQGEGVRVKGHLRGQGAGVRVKGHLALADVVLRVVDAQQPHRLHLRPLLVVTILSLPPSRSLSRSLSFCLSLPLHT